MLISTKICWDTFWAAFFTNSSGHPDELHTPQAETTPISHVGSAENGIDFYLHIPINSYFNLKAFFHPRIKQVPILLNLQLKSQRCSRLEFFFKEDVLFSKRTRSQSYDRELQRQRCNNLQRHE
jgi:hypothetical protein